MFNYDSSIYLYSQIENLNDKLAIYESYLKEKNIDITELNNLIDSRFDVVSSSFSSPVPEVWTCYEKHDGTYFISKTIHPPLTLHYDKYNKCYTDGYGRKVLWQYMQYKLKL